MERERNVSDGPAQRLLVSVRNVAEAESALSGGAGLIDIKEPARGALGSASRDQQRRIVQHVGSRAPVSAALGELVEIAATAAPLPRGIALAKIGLAGCRGVAKWSDNWQRKLRQIAPAAQPVAVIYADWQTAGAPPPGDVLKAAGDADARHLLIDTFDKSQGRLSELWPPHGLSDFVNLARASGMRIVLAGSLNFETIAALLHLAPDWFAVRTAACRAGRMGTVDAALVQKLVELVESGAPCASAQHVGRARLNPA